MVLISLYHCVCVEYIFTEFYEISGALLYLNFPVMTQLHLPNSSNSDKQLIVLLIHSFTKSFLSACNELCVLLQSLLEDPEPMLRLIAVRGVCRIVGLYWELIPATVVQDFLKRVIDDMANDCNSADVRAAVFKVGIKRDKNSLLC